MFAFNVLGGKRLAAVRVFAQIQLDNLELVFPGAAPDEIPRLAIRAEFRQPGLTDNGIIQVFPSLI